MTITMDKTPSMPITVDDLTEGDQFRFTDRGATRTVLRNQMCSSEPGLRILALASRRLGQLGEEERITTPGSVPVIPVKIVRRVYVPCVTWRHGEDLVPVLVDLADGPVPRAVICGKCEGEINVELANEALRREA